MHKRILGLGAVLLTFVLAVGVAQAQPAGQYVNPFEDSAWEVSRTDMGVDWVPVRRVPVLAVGDAVVLGADNHAPWPGHHIIWYQLTDGSQAGDIIYVAEHLKKLAKAGTVVDAGQQIALALPGFPWIEMGWADPYGSPIAYPCYNVDGKQTKAGKEMSRFLRSLGAPVGDQPGPGPDHPLGKHCS